MSILPIHIIVGVPDIGSPNWCRSGGGALVSGELGETIARALSSIIGLAALELRFIDRTANGSGGLVDAASDLEGGVVRERVYEVSFGDKTVKTKVQPLRFISSLLGIKKMLYFICKHNYKYFIL